MDPLRIIFTLVTNLTSKLVRFVNGLFEPTNKSHQIDVEVVSAVKSKTKTEASKTESISTIKPTKTHKEKQTFNTPIQSIQRPPQRPIQGVRDPYGWIDITEPKKPNDRTKFKTRIALNDEGDLIDVYHDGNSYVIE